MRITINGEELIGCGPAKPTQFEHLYGGTPTTDCADPWTLAGHLHETTKDTEALKDFSLIDHATDFGYALGKTIETLAGIFY